MSVPSFISRGLSPAMMLKFVVLFKGIIHVGPHSCFVLLSHVVMQSKHYRCWTSQLLSFAMYAVKTLSTRADPLLHPCFAKNNFCTRQVLSTLWRKSIFENAKSRLRVSSGPLLITSFHATVIYLIVCFAKNDFARDRCSLLSGERGFMKTPSHPHSSGSAFTSFRQSDSISRYSLAVSSESICQHFKMWPFTFRLSFYGGFSGFSIKRGRKRLLCVVRIATCFLHSGHRKWQKFGG